MKKHYKNIRFSSSRLSWLHEVMAVIEEFQGMGYTLTLRQIHYQLVGMGLTENTKQAYKRLGSLINDARLAGYIDWDAIEDRTRFVRKLGHWKEPADIVRSASEQFHIDRWENQEHRVEVWIEKDALVGILEEVCNRYDVPYFSCRGFVSQSELRDAAERVKRYEDKGYEYVILHLGDHDPSGLDMTRDIIDRMEMFGAYPTVDRLALNYEQILMYNPPPNFAKEKDSRYKGYAAEFGTDSWELDSLHPTVIIGLIEHQIETYINDWNVWEDDIEREEDYRQQLADAAKNWNAVAYFLKGNKQ